MRECALSSGDFGVPFAGEGVPGVVAGGELFLVQREMDSLEAVFELLGLAGAEDGGGDAFLREHPGEGDAGQAFLPRRKELLQPLNRFELPRLPVAAAVQLA